MNRSPTTTGQITINTTATYNTTHRTPQTDTIPAPIVIRTPPPEDLTALTTTNLTKRNTEHYGTYYTWHPNASTITLSYTITREPHTMTDRRAEMVDTRKWTLIERRYVLPTIVTAADQFTFQLTTNTTITTPGSQPITHGHTLSMLGPTTHHKYPLTENRSLTLITPQNELTGESLPEQTAVRRTFKQASCAFGSQQAHQRHQDPTNRTQYVFVTTGIRVSQLVGSDMIVYHRHDVRDPSNVWLHEYLHTFQHYERLGPQLRWLDEAMPSYYTPQLTHATGYISDTAYHRELAVDHPRFTDAVLADRSTWESGGVEYIKGRRVLAALDAQIRHHTAGRHSLLDVMRRITHQRNERVTYNEFRHAVVTVANQSTGQWLDKYLESKRENLTILEIVD